MKAVIIGATGSTGNELVQLLLASATVTEIVTLVRKPLTARHPKLTTVVVDFARLGEWASFISGDVAFSCLGTTLRDAGSQQAQYVVDYTYQYEFAKLARANGIPTFILISSSTANPNAFLFYARMKGELEKSVADLGFRNNIVFRPGPLVRPETDRTGEKIGVSVFSFLNKVGLFRQMAPLPVIDLARLMLRYATNPPSGNRILESGQILNEAGY